MIYFQKFEAAQTPVLPFTLELSSSRDSNFNLNINDKYQSFLNRISCEKFSIRKSKDRFGLDRPVVKIKRQKKVL